ncbi:MAG: hypothetical protein QF662_07005, partial [Phycisphaerae bacterium]|nr:hypothetical protein [Phycisphaerae bacterium]
HINSPFALEKQEDGTIVSAEAPGMVVKMAEPDKLAATIMGRKPSNVRNILEGPSHQNTFTVDFEKRGSAKQTVTFGALVAPFAERAEDATVTALPSTGTSRGFVVRFEDGSEEYYLVGGTEERETSFGPVKTDAQAVWLRMVDGQMKAAAVCKGSFLDFNGKRLIGCSSRPETIGVSLEGEKLLVQAKHVGHLTVRAPSAKTVSWNGKPAEFTRKDERVIVDEQGSVWAVIGNNVLRDESDKLTVTINNRTGRKIVGTFLVSIPDLDISYETSANVPADSRSDFTVDVAMPPESAKMDCPISVVMVPERKWLYEGSVKVAPQLEADRTLIWKILPTRAGRDANQDKSKGEVLLEVENRSHSPLQGSVEVSLEGAEQTTSSISMDGLGPFSKKVFAFPFEQSGSPKTVTGKLAIRADGREVNEDLVIDIPVLKRFTAAPVIDADFADWKGASMLHLERPEQIVYDIRGADRKRDKITARGFIGYDEKNLYFAFDVTDPHVLPNRRRGATPWEGTGIELYL